MIKIQLEDHPSVFPSTFLLSEKDLFLNLCCRFGILIKTTAISVS